MQNAHPVINASGVDINKDQTVPEVIEESDDTEYIPDEENDIDVFDDIDEDPSEEELEAISNGDIEGDEI